MGGKGRQRLRSMTGGEVEAMADLVVAGGWADFRSELAFAVGSAAGVALVAEVAGETAGLGVGTRNGSVGWLGPIFTTPAFRRRGIGGALTAAVAARLEAAGCASLLLAATDHGRPVYDRLGFEVDGGYHRLSGPRAALPTAASNAATEVWPLAAADRDEVHALDRWATGEDRGHLLDAFAAGGWVVRDATTGRLRGFGLATPWGAGPVVAPEPGDALALLGRVGGGDEAEMTMALPSGNLAAWEALGRLGFGEVRSLPRMRRGAAVAWRPTAIWRLFSLGMG